MFDFQKLTVYQKAKDFNKEVASLIKKQNFDSTTRDQLRRASFSILLNIAEGSSRFSNKDRKHFMVISRGSAFLLTGNSLIQKSADCHLQYIIE